MHRRVHSIVPTIECIFALVHRVRKMILNLTQHKATKEQIESGVVDLFDTDRASRWNREFKRRQQIKNAAEEEKRVQFVNWIESLPGEIAGFKREGCALMDSYGNEMFDLHAFYPGSIEQIEYKIEELFEDGYDPVG